MVCCPCISLESKDLMHALLVLAVDCTQFHYQIPNPLRITQSILIKRNQLNAKAFEQNYDVTANSKAIL